MMFSASTKENVVIASTVRRSRGPTGRGTPQIAAPLSLLLYTYRTSILRVFSTTPCLQTISAAWQKQNLYTTMPLLRPALRLYTRQIQIQRCAYSSAPSPVLNVTNVPAPHSGSIRILSFNRPAARNAISRQLLAELTHQVKSIHNEGETGATRALILASDIDTSFCAGADLKERATFTQGE
jgi:hypothetical protein